MARRRLGWWLRVVEVRMRFILLVLLVLAVVTQWSRMRSGWDAIWYAMRADARNSVVSGELEYFCPMDPGVLSAWPAICPICNMDLVQRKKGDAQLLPEGVVARMQLSPYRIQLAGIRTAPVERRALLYEISIAGVLSTVAQTTDAQTTESAPDSTPKTRLEFTAAVSREDAALLATPRTAQVRLMDDPTLAIDGRAQLVSAGPARTSAAAGSGDARRSPGVPLVRIETPSGAPFDAGAIVEATILVPAAAMDPPSDPPSTSESDAPSHRGPADHIVAGAVESSLVVPASAVIDHGHQQLVYVESMPGMFDAVVVSVGRRCGDYYPVHSGLQADQQIAVVGAFLIDAETRLNPGIASTYFGAGQAAEAARRTPDVRVAAPPSVLSAEDAALVKRQRICPVTDLPLDSMGGPVAVTVSNRKVFICCKGCESRLRKNASEYLAKLPAP